MEKTFRRDQVNPEPDLLPLGKAAKPYTLKKPFHHKNDTQHTDTPFYPITPTIHKTKKGKGGINKIEKNKIRSPSRVLTPKRGKC